MKNFLLTIILTMVVATNTAISQQIANKDFLIYSGDVFNQTALFNNSKHGYMEIRLSAIDESDVETMITLTVHRMLKKKQSTGFVIMYQPEYPIELGVGYDEMSQTYDFNGLEYYNTQFSTLRRYVIDYILSAISNNKLPEYKEHFNNN